MANMTSTEDRLQILELAAKHSNGELYELEQGFKLICLMAGVPFPSDYKTALKRQIEEIENAVKGN